MPPIKEPADTEQESAKRKFNKRAEDILNREAVSDLFLSNEQRLTKWCAAKGFFSTADILRYATDNFYLRAKRTVNDFVKKGQVRIVPKDECRFINLRGRMRWYCYMSDGKGVLR